jgi:hypothetical protein
MYPVGISALCEGAAFFVKIYFLDRLNCLIGFNPSRLITRMFAQKSEVWFLLPCHIHLSA